MQPDHAALFRSRSVSRGSVRPTGVRSLAAAASVEANTTWHLVADIELIRETLKIDSWIVFGGSWGATLSLIYAQTHPERAKHLVLRGVFLMTQGELDWFYGGGAGRFWPDVWKRFVDLVPEEERGDLIAAYHKRLFGEQTPEQIKFAREWTAWENALASVASNGPSFYDTPAEYARIFARLENHYFVNAGFLEVDGQILRDLYKLKGVGATIVQGRFDMICPPESAWKLKDAWPDGLCDLRMIPTAGHALSESGISSELVRVMDMLHSVRLRSLLG